MNGLRGVRIDWREVEFAGDQEQHGAHGIEVCVAASASFGSLKQAVECFQKAVGLARLGPCDNAIEVFSDHAGALLHGFNLGSHHVGTPLLVHLGNDVDLLTIKDLAQLFSIETGTGSTFGRDVGDQRVQIGSLCHIKPLAVLEQRPTQALEIGIGLLFESPVLVKGGRCLGDDVECVEGNAGVRQMFC